MKKTQGKRCYFCNKPASSREHAPPAQMFVGLPHDSITVPSCSDHNTKKSGKDQAVIASLILPIYERAMRDDAYSVSLEPEVQIAIKHASSAFSYVKRKVISTPLMSDPSVDFSDLPNLSYLTASIDVFDWSKQLTAALIYDAAKIFDPAIDWTEAIAISPDYIGVGTEMPSPIKPAHAELYLKKQGISSWLEELEWYDGWSVRKYPPVIYTFQLHFGQGIVIYKHRFYNRYSLFVAVPISETMASK